MSGAKNPDRYISSVEEVNKIKQQQAQQESAILDQEDAKLAAQAEGIKASAGTEGEQNATGPGTQAAA